jgi:hypothetical protein
MDGVRRCGPAVLLRGALALLLATGLLPWLGPSATPAQADELIVRDHRDACAADPDARVQIILKHVIVHNSGDLLGSGEIDMRFSVTTEGLEGCPAMPKQLVSTSFGFLAGSGEIVDLHNRPFPGGNDELAEGVSEYLGLPLFAGARYVLNHDFTESDSLPDLYDSPEPLMAEMTADNNWFIGRHDFTNLNDEPNVTIGYEIRYAALPDLRPTNISVVPLPGTVNQRICVGVDNRGTEDSGPFEATVYIDGQPAPTGPAQAGNLKAGAHGDLCIEEILPATGAYKLSAAVDEARHVSEINERNNAFDQMFLARTTVTEIGPNLTIGQPSGSSAAAALAIADIRVRGQVPDGKNDCKEGKNDISVQVENSGAAASGAFKALLTINGDEETDRSAAALDPGKSLNFTFDDVRLKKGNNSLTATLEIDQLGTQTEPTKQQKPITKTVTANCKEDD